ncbi:MAG: type IV-A pilus assembly ATPase PilB [Candidatus Parcubacteria bacterium]|nr:MAG: type IV-A pilus assembly ATPase PilB [Candidatus Parcubacteria bacterium]
MPQFDDRDQEKKLETLRKQEEEDLARILSQKYGVGYVDLTRIPIDTDALRLIPETTAREAELVPFKAVRKKIWLAAKSPAAPKTREVIDSLERRGLQVMLFMASRNSLEHAWERYKDLTFAVETSAGVIDISQEEIQRVITNIRTIEDVTALMQETAGTKQAYKVSRLLEVVLGGALALRASDVHIEPEEEAVRLRFRLDGVLTPITTMSHETARLLVPRLKLLSGMKLNVTNAAQDGRFTIRVEDKEIEVRASAIPGNYGESLVMRILDPTSLRIPLERLGMHPVLLERMEAEILRPNGMILNTGPTGSGKTTTLYAILSRIKRPEIKIITIEDPIEYHLEGIVQTQVQRGKYTFAQALRAALRQDPDVIMVGEIRDPEVADTAVQAALTGHLVLSTLHTNTAAGAIPRLIGLNVNPQVIGSAVNVVMAQRLVRVLRPECRVEVPLSGVLKDFIQRVIDSLPPNPAYQPKQTEVHYIPKPGGECLTGYKGRVAVFETVFMDEKIETLAAKGAGERDIQAAAREQGFLDMVQDGVLKVLNGTTSFEELVRVVEVDPAVAAALSEHHSLAA